MSHLLSMDMWAQVFMGAVGASKLQGFRGRQPPGLGYTSSKLFLLALSTIPHCPFMCAPSFSVSLLAFNGDFNPSGRQLEAEVQWLKCPNQPG